MSREGGRAVRKIGRHRTRYFFAIPVLSLLLVGAALAGTGVLHRDFTLFDDGALKITIRVQQFARRNQEFGNVMGIMTVTNNHPFSIQLREMHVIITSGDTSGGSFVADTDPAMLTFLLSKSRIPETFPPISKTNKQFFATLTGDLRNLNEVSDFSVVASPMKWVELHPDGSSVLIVHDFDVVCEDAWATLDADAVGSTACSGL